MKLRDIYIDNYRHFKNCEDKFHTPAYIESEDSGGYELPDNECLS